VPEHDETLVAPNDHQAEPELGRSGWPAGVGLLATAAGGVGFAWAFAADASHYFIGGFLALGLVALGFTLAYWGRNLINDVPATGLYPAPSDDEAAQAALAKEVVEDAQVITRRRFLTTLLIGGAGIFGLSQIFLIGALGPRPRRSLFHTQWTAGAQLVTVDGQPVTRDMLAHGGFLVAFPQGHTEAADSQVVLLRLPSRIFTPLPGRESWSPEGFVAYSRVCTHAGCAVAQYEDQDHVLLCPCHQSTFDVLQGARPISGPAGRALPQLPLMIDAAGNLRAQRDFEHAVGPGFWNLS
jgi:ubiquinol-cytochrome c reductase iron-sulfur subunit